MKVLRIKDWDLHFGNSHSRKVVGPLRWVAIPTKHDGSGYRDLVTRPNGAAFYGAWVAMVAVAGKAPVRGYLIDDRTPLSPRLLMLKTGLEETIFSQTIDFLTKEIGWMEFKDIESIADLIAESGMDSTSSGDGGMNPDTAGRCGPTGQVQEQDITGPVSGTGAKAGNSQRGNSGSKGPRPGSAFECITTETLKSLELLKAWQVMQSTRPRPVIGTSHQALEVICAAALQALTHANPPAKFAQLMKTSETRKADILPLFVAKGIAFAKGAA